MLENKFFLYNKFIKLPTNFGSDLILKNITGVLKCMEISLILLCTIVGVLLLLSLSIIIFGIIIWHSIKKLSNGKVSYVDNRVEKQDNKVLVLADAIKSAEKYKDELNSRIENLKCQMVKEVEGVK